MADPLEVAIAAARAAGAIQRAGWRLPVEVRERSKHDIKLQTDVDCERVILEVLQAAFPEYGVLAEESGGTIALSQPTWVIDPLDGTVNFSRQLPHFCTSIALYQDARPVVGVVYDPIVDELFTAVEGGGAYLNGERMTVSTVAELGAANIAVGFAKTRVTRTNALDDLTRLAHTVHKVRIMGAAALDLAYVAAGRFDGFREYGLQTWDIAAGTLLVREAGGKVLLTKTGDHQWDVQADNGQLL